MTKTTLPSRMSVGELREALKYRSREAMNTNWTAVFTGEILPEDHLFVSFNQALEFVAQIAIPQRGRPGAITGAAQQLLKSWRAPEQPDEHLIDAVIRLADEDGNKTDQLNGVDREAEFLELVEKNREEEENAIPQSLIWYRLELKKVRDEINGLPEDELKSKKGDELRKKARFLEFKIAGISRPKKTVLQKIVDFFAGLTGLDWVYLVTVGIADYGLIILLKEMGLAAGLVYTLISFHALGMAKNRKAQSTATRGITAVWALEILAFFVHLTLFNRRLWGAVSELPFNLSEDLNAEYRPFLIALILASLFSAAGIYAVSTTLALLKESIDAEEYELQHGKQY